MPLDGPVFEVAARVILRSPASVNGAVTGQLRCLELFAGPGGLALGAHRAGFQHLALIEFEATAAQTLRLNCEGPLQLNPDVVLEKGARDVDYEPFAGKVDLLTAGPPCQPFSRGGDGLGPSDPRNMFPTLLDAVAVILPRAVFIENVYGLISSKFQRYFRYIQLRLQFPLHAPTPNETWDQHLQRLERAKPSSFGEHEQFVVWFQLVDAADYGIPQRRHRVFILALRRDLHLEKFVLPATHSRLALLHAQWITRAYWERHGIAAATCDDPSDAQAVKRLPATLFPSDGLLSWRTVRDAIGDLPEPIARGEKETLPNHVQHPGARSYAGHVGSKLDYPAKALKAGAHGTPGGENMVQVQGVGVRYFTTREAARLQTFPDDWVFHGPWGACIKQLGNAVPVELAARFINEIHRRLLTVSAASIFLSGHDTSSSAILPDAAESPSDQRPGIVQPA